MQIRPRHWLAVCAALLLSASVASAATRHVNVRDFEFTPRTVQIQPADQVDFAFKGPSDHTATLRSGQTDRYDSGLAGDGATRSHRFNYPGSFALFCRLHTQMTGRVTVGTPEAVAPRIRRLRARGGDGTVTLVFRLSERSVVTVTVGGRKVRKVFNRGRRKLTVRRVASGRRTANVLAKDGWGNRSRAKKSVSVG